MIKSFKSKEAEKIFKREFSKRIAQNIQRLAMKRLWMLDAAPDINSLRVPPSNHLELLSGDRNGQYSIRINKQWRICFEWNENNAYNVEITDYH
jgi:toxin HigB-1